MKPEPSLDALIRLGDTEELRHALQNLSGFEIADMMTPKSEQEQLRVFSALSNGLAAETFGLLPTRIQTSLLHILPSMQAASILSSFSPDNRTAFLQELPRETIDELVKLLPTDEGILTLTLLGYPEGSIGRLMTTDYIAIKKEWSVEQALEHIRDYGHSSETVDVIYVVEDDRLIGEINIKEFLFVSKERRVEEFINERYPSLSVYEKDESAINIFKKSNRTALPVVDDHYNLLGVVTADDVLRLSNREATREIQKIGGMGALDTPYMQTPFFELIKKRAGWLIVFFLGGTLSGPVLAYFKDEIFRAVILAFFLPLVLSSGGNAGSQASALVIRSMTLGEIKIGDWWKVFKREFLSGLFLGVLLGVIGFLRMFIFSFFSDMYGEHWLLIALTVGLALCGVILWGSLAGALLPFIFKWLGFDPATSSLPFVSTIVNVTGLIIYFMIALHVLQGTLL